MIARYAKGLTLVLGLCALAGVATIARHGSGARRTSPLIVSVMPQNRGYSTPPAAEPRNKVVYPYSVVPGGVASGAELQARAAKDGVVAEHFRNFAFQNARTVRLEADREAYVSYRKGNDIYWTRKRVRLRKGELLITDGTTTIRSRCGNQVCDVPRAPVANLSEPTQSEMDAPVAAVSGIPALEGVPLLASLNEASLTIGSGSEAYEIPAASGASPGTSPTGRRGGGSARGGSGGGPAGGGTGAGGSGGAGGGTNEGADDAGAPNQSSRIPPAAQPSEPPPGQSQPGAPAGGTSARTGNNFVRRPGPEPESFNEPPPPNTSTEDGPAPWPPETLEDPGGIPPGNTTPPESPITVPPGAQVLPEQDSGRPNEERFPGAVLPVAEPPTWILTALACALFCGRSRASKSPVWR